MLYLRNELMQKEKEAIQFIRNAYSLALNMSDEGFHLAFSGGKDSLAIYALMELSGCKYKAHMQVTSVDSPQLMKFVRKNYSDVQLHLPKENMKQLIIRRGVLPMRQMRYCCQELKEHAGAGTVTCVGLRKYESVQRGKRSPIELKGKKGESFNIEEGKLIKKIEQFDLFEIKSETIIACVNGDDKIIISPIFHWITRFVWEIINYYNLDFCELYKMGLNRIGCLFCPMASAKQKAIEYKLFKRLAENIYIEAIAELMKMGKYLEFDTPEDVFFWWISNTNRDEWLANKKMYKLQF